MTKQNPLIGKTIISMQRTTDNKALRFALSDGTEVVANADGDCCSDTWVEHITLPARGFPALVLDAHEIEMPDLGDMEDRDVVAYYGFEIKTDKGDITIDYRNDSNGYYGGELVWPGERFYGGVCGQNVPNDDWVAVTEDV